MSVPDLGLADLESHHIEGIAIHGNTPFSCPLISHVEGNLFMGGCRDGLELPDTFEYVISLYQGERFVFPDNATVLDIRMNDASEMPSEILLRDLSKIGHAFQLAGKTLIHCQAGLNRSGLVTALVLMRGGKSAEEAIELLRERRSRAVLCNSTFEQYLRSKP